MRNRFNFIDKVDGGGAEQKFKKRGQKGEGGSLKWEVWNPLTRCVGLRNTKCYSRGKLITNRYR